MEIDFTDIHKLYNYIKDDKKSYNALSSKTYIINKFDYSDTHTLSEVVQTLSNKAYVSGYYEMNEVLIQLRNTNNIYTCIDLENDIICAMENATNFNTTFQGICILDAQLLTTSEYYNLIITLKKLSEDKIFLILNPSKINKNPQYTNSQLN